jgi:cytochrome P450
MDEMKMSQVNQYAYQPFSKGPRDCIGQTFAILEAKTLLAMLYAKFSFQYAGSEPERQTFQLTSHPLYGAPMRVIKRCQ